MQKRRQQYNQCTFSFFSLYLFFSSTFVTFLILAAKTEESLHSLYPPFSLKHAVYLLAPSLAKLKWHGLILSDRIQRPYCMSRNALRRTFTKGRHSVDVDLIECHSDNCNYLLTSCKSVALRDRFLRRMFNSSSEYYYIFLQDLILQRVLSSRASHKCYLCFIKLCGEKKSLVQYKFRIVEMQRTKGSFPAHSATIASTSATVNKYLRQSRCSTLISGAL